jgi:uncharacterized protein YyaL (SSP411 family)
VLGGDVRGLLEDQVFLAQALLDAHQATGEARWRDAARGLLDGVLARHTDEHGLLLDRARDAPADVPALRAPRAAVEDAPTPSPNSVAAWSLDRLAALTDEARYRDAAGRILRATAGGAPRLGALFGGSFFLALDQHVRGPVHVSIVGQGAAARALHEQALRCADPLVLVSPPGEAQRLPAPAQRALLSTGRAEACALVCRGDACGPPVRSPPELARVLQGEPPAALPGWHATPGPHGPA